MAGLFLAMSHGRWRVSCSLKIADKCLGWYWAWDPADDGMCPECEVVQKRLDKEAYDRWYDQVALTPDDHPTKGFISILTEEERWNLRLGVPKWH